MSFGVLHPPEIVRAAALEAAPLWNGGTPEFLALNLNASGGANNCGASARGVTVAMVGDPANPGSRTIGPGIDQTIGTLVYDVTSSVPQISLELTDYLIPSPGSPPTSISVTCDSDTVRPSQVEGAVITLTGEACRRRGFCNDDGIFDISDAVLLLSFLFSGGRAPSCPDACDCKGDGQLDISAGICFLNHLFLGGLQPTPSYAARE